MSANGSEIEIKLKQQRLNHDFDLLQDDAKRAWWDETRRSAKTTIQMHSGTTVYVANALEDLAQHEQRYAFLKVAVVSIAVNSQFEFRRTVQHPPLHRLLPLAKIASMAPIVDDEVPT